MLRKLLVVCGPTATGKTSLGIYLAKKFKGEMVSADSRQVYKKMDIGTGKDLPVNSQFTIFNSQLGGFYEIDGVKLWGYDLVGPTEEFSVAEYIKIAKKIIMDIWGRGKLPILVGGTGLYIKAVIDGIPTAVIPRNIALRESLGERRVEELFEILAEVDPLRAASLNASDKKNPRRLVRAIEIASSKLKVKSSPASSSEAGRAKLTADVSFIGLKAPKQVLNQNIERRVEGRKNAGIEEELISLLTSGVSWESQAMNSLGYKEWRKYFKTFGRKSGSEKRNLGLVSSSESTERKKAIEDWVADEKQYAKRQITWFKKDKRIVWFDVSESNWQKSVEKLVRKWYKT